MENKKQSLSAIPLPPRKTRHAVSVSIEPKETYAVDVIRKTWTSCCFQCDREVVLYATKTVIQMGILVFAMYRIGSNNDPCKDMAFPTGLICTILGSYIEQGHQKMVKK